VISKSLTLIPIPRVLISFEYVEGLNKKNKIAFETRDLIILFICKDEMESFF
jgi:hypothetical protein